MSINQNANAGALPSFRNLGILLRILVIVDGISLAVAMVRTQDPLAMMEELIEISAVVQPILMLSLLVLALANSWLRKLRYLHAIVALLALEVVITVAVFPLVTGLFSSSGSLPRYVFFTLMVTAILTGYFDLRGRALSPALTEARLQALQARIRPHFLFNSINAVLSLIREHPRRAEQVLEDLADLFRVLMADNRQLVTVGSEIELARQYLNIETLRLGDRLRVEWDTDGLALDALIPPMVLQPLLENAVYHGIEPRIEPGVISISVKQAGNHIHLCLTNPYRQDGEHHAGNHMALDNIRERLTLHFDAEASLKTSASNEAYRVDIVMPYLKQSDLVS